MIKVFLDRFCREHPACENYYEWVDDVSIDDHNRTYHSTIDSCSCKLLEKDNNITTVPEHCLHKEAIEDYKERDIIETLQWQARENKNQIRREKERMWRRLEKV